MACRNWTRLSQTWSFSRADAQRLTDRFGLVWLEHADPDRTWTHGRLSAMGLPIALIATPETAPEPQAGMFRFAVAADRFLLVTSPAVLCEGCGDAAGISAGLSMDAVLCLLRRSRPVIGG
jgi:hypothetical protein